MNVHVCDVNEHLQVLIRSGRAIDLAELTDSDTPFESRAGGPATGS